MEAERFSRRDFLTSGKDNFFKRFSGGKGVEMQDQPAETMNSNQLLKRLKLRRDLIRWGNAALIIGLGGGTLNLLLGKPATTTVREKINGKEVKVPEDYIELTPIQNDIDHGCAIGAFSAPLAFGIAATIGDVPAATEIDAKTEKTMMSTEKVAVSVVNFLNIRKRGNVFPQDISPQIPETAPQHVD